MQVVYQVEKLNMVHSGAEKVQNSIESIDYDIQNIICQKYINDIDVLISSEKYEAAQTKLEMALGYFPDNNQLLEKYSEIAALLFSDIEGKWSAQYDFGDMIAAELGLSGMKIYFPATMVFDFSGNKVSIYVDESSISSAIDEMTKDSESMKAFYEVAAQYGVSKFTADLLVKFTYGGSYSAFLTDQFGGEINGALATFACSEAFCADSRKIYIGTTESNSSSYCDYSTKEGGKLLLEAYTGNHIILNSLNYPIELTRKF